MISRLHFVFTIFLTDAVLVEILKTSQRTLNLLSRKFESKPASELSPAFYSRLPLTVTGTGILKEGTKADFDTVLQFVEKYAVEVQLLLREHGIRSIDEKRHIKPLSMALLQSVVNHMLRSLNTTILTETKFHVALCFDNVTTRVSGRFDKTICFNDIQRHLLAFEDKNPSVSVDSYKPVSQTVSQVISISRELAKCYNIAFPRIVGFICNGIEFTKVEYGLLGGEEHINLTPKETLIDTSHGDFTINEGATTTVAKYLIHGVIIARNLFLKLLKMPLDFKDDVVDEEKDEALDDSEGDEGEDKDVINDVLLPLERTALTSIVEDKSGKHPMNRRSSQRPGQAYFQPFLTEELLFQHTLITS